MISQARIEKSKERYRRFADKRGLVSQIPATKKLNKGRTLKPLKVTEYFQDSADEMNPALSEAAQSFGTKPRGSKTA
jgi:hypothetical protein